MLGRAAQSMLAGVVCRQLGLVDAPALAEDPLAYGMPTLTSWLNLTSSSGSSGCQTGQERSLLDCSCSTYVAAVYGSGWVTRQCMDVRMVVSGNASTLRDFQLTVACPPPTSKQAGHFQKLSGGSGMHHLRALKRG